MSLSRSALGSSYAVIAATLLACQISSEAYRELDPAADTLRAERAGGHVDLDAETTVNPIGVVSIAERASQFIPRHFTGLESECEGFATSRPAMVLHSSQPIETAQITAGGDAEFLVIAQPDGSTLCASAKTEPQVQLDDGPAGRYRIYAGMHDRYEYFEYEILVENQRAPLTIPWHEDDEVRHVQIDNEFTDIVQMDLEIHDRDFLPIPPLMTPPSCLDDEHVAHHRPVARLNVDEPTSVHLVALAADSPVIVLTGPLLEDGRPADAQCLPHRVDDLALEAGVYFVYTGIEATNGPQHLELLVYSSSSDIDPAHLARNPSSHITVEQRTLQHFYPFLSIDELWSDDALRALIFATAPSELFVGLGSDVDDPQLLRAPDGDSEPRHRSSLDDEVLSAGEILLRIDDEVVLTADGLLYFVPDEVFVTAGGLDSITYPENARSPRLSLAEALSFATREESSLIGEYRRRHQRFEICSEDIYAAIDAELDEMEAQGASSTEIDALVDQTQRRIRRECDLQGLERDDERLRQTLEDSRTQRRQSSLEEHIERLQSLFE